MRWVQKLNEKIKHGVRSWLQVQPSQPYAIQIQEVVDFELSAIRNRIWFRGDSNEIEQMYQQNPEWADKYKFWASKCTPGMEMRKIHTGLPGLIVRTLSYIVLTDMNDPEFTDAGKHGALWDEIERENEFKSMINTALEEVLFIGDGAFKVTVDTELSKYPLLEWYPGERIEIVKHRGKVREVVFKTVYKAEGKQYVLNEQYGYGYIKNELYQDEKLVPMESLAITKGISDWEFDKSVFLAVPMQVFKSKKFEGRGGSVFDGKLDNFDAFDEAWSQWMDALRAGRARTFVPESYIPRDPQTGKLMKPSPFDNRFIKGDNDMSENGKNEIKTEQPAIPHDSYLATYSTALDLCLQGIISPSTLGIDVKKVDNAEAQREKEKATLYTRNAIIEALQDVLPKLIKTSINAYNLLNKLAVEDVKVDVSFGEYANPSFESQVETLAKARPGSPIMSVEAQVEELYGDSKEKAWKEAEVARIKAELGIAKVEEPGVNQSAGDFHVTLKEGQTNEGNSNETQLPDEPGKVSGTS